VTAPYRRSPSDIDIDVAELKERAETDGVRISTLERFSVDVCGSSGNNGKLGALKARFDTAESRKWWVVTFAAGLLVTVITAAVTLGVWIGRIDADVATLKQRVRAGSAGFERTSP
jgi:hypothetical protein